MHITPPKYIGSSVASLRQFIQDNTRQPLPFLHQLHSYRRLPRGVIEFEFEGDSAEELRNQMVSRMISSNENYYIIILDVNNHSITLRRAAIFNRHTTLHAFYDLFTMLNNILERCEEYDVHHDYLVVQLHKQININPRITNQRDGLMNCACKAVLDQIQLTKDSKKKRWLINNVKAINTQYFDSGINDIGLQELSDKTSKTLIVKDSIGEVWREFTPTTNNTRVNKLLLVAHNNHIKTDEPYDSDDETENTKTEDYISIPLTNDDVILKRISGETNVWYDSNEQVIEKAHKYEKDGQEGTPIISKGELIAYITPDNIYKTKFDEYELYPDCFTSAGVGKAKFIEQHPEYEYGCDKFHSLLMDADVSGFYCRTSESQKTHTKYDQNSAYKSSFQ